MRLVARSASSAHIIKTPSTVLLEIKLRVRVLVF